MKAHRSFLKICHDKNLQGKPLPLFFYQRTEQDLEAEPSEWKVEKILRHKKDSSGKVCFLTHWVGYPESDATWEPVENFIHTWNPDFVNYCKTHKIPINLTQYLAESQAEE